RRDAVAGRQEAGVDRAEAGAHGHLRYRRIGAAHRQLSPCGGCARLSEAVSRRFDLWGVPFDGAATLGWPGSRYAPERVRAALQWMLMRPQNEQIYSIDTGRLHPFPNDLLRIRGDAEVVAHDLMASLDACTAAVASSITDGRVPIVIGGDDSLLYACVKGFHDSHEGPIGILHFDAHLDLMDESRQVLDCSRMLASHCEGLSIVEVNPLTDTRDMTSILAANLAFDFALFGHKSKA